MWNLLKKAGEFIAPTGKNDLLEDFKDKCKLVLTCLERRDKEDVLYLQSGLTILHDFLLEEIDQSDPPCFSFFSDEHIFTKLVEKIDKDTPNGFISHLLRFALVFLRTNLNVHFPEKSIHEPFTSLIVKLPLLYGKSPDSVRDFLTVVWTSIKKNSILLELLVISDSEGRSYPLIRFFVNGLFLLNDIGSLSREALLYLYSSESSIPVPIQEATSKSLYPKLVDFLIMTFDFVETYQFSGSATKLIGWTDQIFVRLPGFPVESIIEPIATFPLPQQQLVIAFLLTYFSSFPLVECVVKYATTPSFLQGVIDVLDSDNPKSALLVLHQMILVDQFLPHIMPPLQTQKGEFGSLIPTGWKHSDDDSLSQEAYQIDCTNRLSLFPHRIEGASDKHVAALLGVFRRFSELPLSTAVSVTALITLFLSAAPDLSGLVAAVFSEVVGDYAHVTMCPAPAKDSQDTPQLRAGLLAEFGRELEETCHTFKQLEAIRADILSEP